MDGLPILGTSVFSDRVGVKPLRGVPTNPGRGDANRGDAVAGWVL